MITAEDLNYAENLKVLRRASGWKQALAAEKIGLSSQQEYSKLESGKMPFSEELLKKICIAFRVTRDHFKIDMKGKYKFDWRDYIKEGKVSDLIELVNNKGLVTMMLSTEIRAMELELELIDRQIKDLMLPKFEDVPEDKEYNIWVMM
ncbi:MAG: helix-turn-helix transcriptional regulator [Bacteroidia bacterium]|nr:helix-turn-helix transcriptional regulator [Bacteroidia bacterium]